jgi:hypothetical protein
MAEEEQVVEEPEIDLEELEAVSGGDEGSSPPPIISDGR